MSTILQFRPKSRITAEPAQRTGPATVIIFPGIRYERRSDADDGGSDKAAVNGRPQKPGRRRRSTL